MARFRGRFATKKTSRRLRVFRKKFSGDAWFHDRAESDEPENDSPVFSDDEENSSGAAEADGESCLTVPATDTGVSSFFSQCQVVKSRFRVHGVVLTKTIIDSPFQLSENCAHGDCDGESAVEPVLEGRRIVELQLIIDRLRAGCCGCKARLCLCDLVRENRFGLASILVVRCASCGLENMVQTSKTHPGSKGKRRSYDVNSKAALGELSS